MRPEDSDSMRYVRYVVLMAMLVAFTAARSAYGRAPNVVIILADDLGYGDPTCYRSGSKIPTPRIDALAAGGMRFTDAHTPTAVCTPTRYALLTGQFAWRTRLKKGVLGPYSAPLIEPDRLTLGKMLKANGYTTSCIGKWHLGMQWATKNPGVMLPPLWDRKFDQSQIDLAGRITAGPLTAGFDSYFGTAVPNFPPYCFIENDHVLGKVPDRPKPENVYGNAGLMQEGWDLHGILPALKQRAVAFIDEQAGQEAPLFLYLPLTAPHTPIVPNKEFADCSEAGDYGDLVCEVDAIVGAVVDALERNGLAKDTLVLFTSDNGSPARAGDPHIRGKDWHVQGATITKFGHNPNAPWRGMKADAFEGGHRVPMIVCWPGRVKAGSVNDQLVGLVDWMATMADVLGHELGPEAGEDSVSLLPTLDAPGKPIRENLVHHSSGGTFALRSGPWKLIAGKGSGGWTRVKTGKDAPPGQLYNLEDDPGETQNLYRKHPEMVQRLTARLKEYRHEPAGEGED